MRSTGIEPKVFQVSFFQIQNSLNTTKMTMWADNVKFVKDIIDSKYLKIDTALTEVLDKEIIFLCVCANAGHHMKECH